AGIRGALPDVQNIGLNLRWEAGLWEMEQFAALEPHKVREACDAWRKQIVSALRSRSRTFELMPGETDPTIVSFRCRAPDGHFLTREELARVYAYFLTTRHTVHYHDRTFIGQPVAYPGGAFLRFAIGAQDLRHLIANRNAGKLDREMVVALECVVRQIING